ncbi:hypothetical protein D4Z93_08880 [Clostridium fermenticellae]|uniref:Cell division protein FtsL n=1 Tax=Clostridium fermenticellae TaxID=2068654 RepID=A0A386H4H7_9CLOT|nr:hypothetical protein [Clostridium fermenticellae]AYD40637.1 hypothetical protein D4Z93_08880 [Clostridium fermenticellae]
MIVVNKDTDTIHGNTVLKPEEIPDYNKDYLENNKEKILKRKKLKQKRVKNKVKTLRNIICIFVVGLVLIGRYCNIYNMQMQLNAIDSNINKLVSENEQLKVNLVQYNNIQYIESTAVNRLHMVFPDKKSAVYMDLDKKNINTTPKKETKGINGQNLWNKLVKNLY